MKVNEQTKEAPRRTRKNLEKKEEKKRPSPGAIITLLPRWLSMNTNRESPISARAVFLVSAYAKPVSRDGCSQSPGLWIMHAIFARGKRNVRSYSRICILYIYMHICISMYNTYMRFSESAGGTARLLGWFIRGGLSALKRRAVVRSSPTSRDRPCLPRPPRGDSAPSSSISRHEKEIPSVKAALTAVLMPSAVQRRDFLLGNCRAIFGNAFSKIISWGYSFYVAIGIATYHCFWQIIVEIFYKNIIKFFLIYFRAF